MRILFITSEFPPGPGGIGNHAWNLSKYLQGISIIDILAISDYSDVKNTINFDNRNNLNTHRFKRYLFPFLTQIMRAISVLRFVKNNKYTHCLLSGRFALWMSCIISYLSSETKLIAILHGSELKSKNIIYKILLRKSLHYMNNIISVSEFTDRLIPTIFLRSKKVVIPNGIDYNDLINNEYSIPYDLCGNPRFLTVGSITNRKGQVNFINLLPEIIKKYPRAHYHCVGLKFEEKKLNKLINKYQLQDHITLHGFIENRYLWNIYKQADILVLLSEVKLLKGVEGFGISILEANAFGIPAIGSQGSGIDSAIKHQETGILASPYNCNEILDGVEFILKNRNHLSQNAIKWAQEHDWKIIGKKYLQAINNA